MSSLALRAFIRESLVLEIGDSMGQDLRYNPRQTAPYTPQVENQHPGPNDNLAGRSYSIKSKGEPDFVVMADNTQKNLCIIRQYSTSTTPYESIRVTLGGREIDLTSKWLDNVVNQLEGWNLTERTHTKLQDDIALEKTTKTANASSILGSIEESSGTQYMLVNRALDRFYLPPRLATPEGQEAALNFECDMSQMEAVTTVLNVSKVKTKDWFRAAACFYSYANGLESLIFCSLVGGTLTGLGFGPVAAVPGAGWVAEVGAILSGAAMGATLCDLVLRLPVLIWASANGKTAFAAANLVYMIITAAFSSVSAFKAAKGMPTSFKMTLVEFLLQLTTTIIAELNLPLSDSESMKKIREFFNNPDMLTPMLSASEDELLKEIRNQYPEF